ncbi:GTP cyclohydrolase II [Iodidimonas nitroreducens]|uniref:GTP cyclohydrolase II n=1 Tax=Iodidimonas nitroreducens TaxID=1236968 RepID=UPI000693F252|nr:GTP cyclohydrolase II [Iodidimonas nitroreducens]
MGKAFLQTQQRDIVAIGRAAGDLRRGLPVLIAGDMGARSRGKGAPVFAVFPAEMADLQRLAQLAPFGRAQLLISRERAAVLKIRHKGRAAVPLACPDWLSPAQMRALADPTFDLAAPLKGPFQMIDDDLATTDLHEAALRLLKIARLLPAALIFPLDGDPQSLADHHGVLWVEKEKIALADDRQTADLRIVADARLPIEGAVDSRIIAFRPISGGIEHFAILLGDPAPSKPVLVRLHSECFTGDALGSLKCDCGSQFRGALESIRAAGGGLLLYLAQEGRGIGLIAKLKAYALQDLGHDTVDANLRLGFATDERVFAPAAAMLKALGFTKIRLLTNNPAKVSGLEDEGITILERVEHSFPANDHNAHYLATKRDKTGHFL